MFWRRVVASLAVCAPAFASLASERFEIRFSEHLGLGDLRLFGTRATREVEFQWPGAWRAQPGAELRLRFEHSPALDGERSFLAVSLNHGVLRSLRLDATNATASELIVPVSPAMLRDENQLVISVEQFSTSGAVKDAWTQVSAESSVAIPFERQHGSTSLAELPEPLLRKHSYEPRRLTILLPTRPTLSTLEATARSLASLAAHVAPAPVTLAFARSLREAATPTLVVGTAVEQPSLRELGDLGEGASTARAGIGVVALVPEAGPSAQPVLVVTGKEPGDVAKAALGLFEPRRKGSRVLLVPAAPERRAPGPREWLRFIP